MPDDRRHRNRRRDIDAFVADVTSELPTGGGTTTTTTSTTTTTTTPACHFPATGQTTCWNSSGTVIPCAGTGQDGELQKGAPLSYTDNGDGTITDSDTGLVWEKMSADGTIHDVGNTYSLDQAVSVHVAGLNGAAFAGHTDWRVPNVRELASLPDLENFNPSVAAAFNASCSPGCSVTMCSCTTHPGGFYWSATIDALGPGDAFDVGSTMGS